MCVVFLPLTSGFILKRDFIPTLRQNDFTEIPRGCRFIVSQEIKGGNHAGDIFILGTLLPGIVICDTLGGRYCKTDILAS